MPHFIPFTSDYEIAAIANGLLDRTLPKAVWTHAAHFAAALWLLKCSSAVDACLIIRRAIRAYNEATGVSNTDSSGYHETITQASLRAAAAFLAERRSAPLFMVCNELMGSSFGRPDWLLAYWSRAQLFSVEARRNWLEPDLHPLPF